MLKFKDSKLYFSILGIVLIIFSSLYIFTRPAIWSEYDFSSTGDIGDTIGGITAPIINLIGAFLLYISFKEQIKANSEIYKATLEQRKDRNFEIVLNTFLDLKSEFINLEYKNIRSTAALNCFINDFNKTQDEDTLWVYLGQPIFSELTFIISQYDFIIFQIMSGSIRNKEKSILETMIINYYISRLENPLNIINAQLIKYNAKPDIQYIINRVIKFNLNNNCS